MVLQRALAVLLASSTVFGASIALADVVTLDALEAQALRSSPTIRAQAARARAAQARVDGLRAEALPSLNLDTGASAGPGAIIAQQCAYPDGRDMDGIPGADTYVCYLPGTATAGSNGDAFIPALRVGASLRFEGPLYDFGRTDARVHGGLANAQAEEFEVDAQREQAVRSVRTAYLAWLGAHLRRTFVERGLASANERVRAIESAMESGARPAFDRDAALLEVARIRLELARSEAAEADARAIAAYASNTRLAHDAEPDAALLELVPPNRRSVVSPIARALESRREAANAAGRLHSFRYAPILTGGAQLGIAVQFANRQDPVWLPNYQLQLALTMPLWEPRTEHHVYLEAHAQADAFEAAATEAQSAAEAQDRRARQQYDRTNEQVELAAEVVRLAERAAASSEERWRIAGGSIESVLSAHESIQRAREEHMRARIERADAVLRLVPVE